MKRRRREGLCLIPVAISWLAPTLQPECDVSGSISGARRLKAVSGKTVEHLSVSPLRKSMYPLMNQDKRLVGLIGRIEIREQPDG